MNNYQAAVSYIKVFANPPPKREGCVEDAWFYGPELSEPTDSDETQHLIVIEGGGGWGGCR